MKRGQIHSVRQAFTLIELLVVIAIIGLLAGVGLPALKGLNSTSDVSTANRQLVDDLGYARMTAINDRTTVYVVFLTPQILNQNWNAKEWASIKKIINGQYSSYAVFANRSLGDQPGPGNARYLTEWKTLPDGTYISTNKFKLRLPGQVSSDLMVDRGLPQYPIPFPNATNKSILLPCIAFDYLGRLTEPGDQILPIAKGAVLVQDPDAKKAPEVIETPKGNYTNNPAVTIDWLTGRARSEQFTRL